jgi:hypothetical protein
MSKTGFDTEYAAASGRGVSIFARKRQLTVFIDVAVSGHGGWCRPARGLTLVSSNRPEPAHYHFSLDRCLPLKP